MKPVLLMLLCPLLLGGCQDQIPPEDYFPLQEGVRWHYRVETHRGDQVETRLFSIENTGRVAFDGKYFDLPVTVRRTSDGTDYYILDAEDGKFRIAKRTVVELKPRFDDKERRILPHQDALSPGQSWFSAGTTYLLRGRRTDIVPDTRDLGFSMEYEIASLTDTVEVPAGRYQRCIRVEGKGEFSLYVDPRLGYQDVRIEQNEWYAPGVGLVKLVRNEPREIGLYQGGVMKFELVKMER